MKYLLIMCGDETAEAVTLMTTAAADIAAMPACSSWIAEMERRGVLPFSSRGWRNPAGE